MTTSRYAKFALSSAILITVITAFGCESAKEKLQEKVAEKIVEAASGADIDVEGNTVKIKSREGSTTVTESDQKIVMKSDKAHAVYDGKTKEATIKSEDGTMHMGKKLPEGFPLPIIDGAEIVTALDLNSKKDGQSFMVSLKTTSKDAADIAAYYEGELKKDGLEVKKMETKTDAMAMFVLSGKGDGIDATVQVIKQAAKPETMVNIALKKKSAK